MRSIDFTMAYPKAILKTDIYMEIPQGFDLEVDEDIKYFCLKLIQNIYGLKDGGYNWFECLKEILIARGFTQSTIDPCLFTRNRIIMVVYVDDIVITAKTKSEIELLLALLKDGLSMQLKKIDPALQKFTFIDDRDLTLFLGIEIDPTIKGKHLRQLYLINQILQALDLERTDITNTSTGQNIRDMPAVKPLLIKDLNEAERKGVQNY